MDGFDIDVYSRLYPSLIEDGINTPRKLINYYLTEGKSKNHIINRKQLELFIKKIEFDWQFYKLIYRLKEINSEFEAIRDYINSGKKKTFVNKNFFFKSTNFNIDIYKKYNRDLIGLNYEQLINHFILYGFFEKRVYSIKTYEEENNKIKSEIDLNKHNKRYFDKFNLNSDQNIKSLEKNLNSCIGLFEEEIKQNNKEFKNYESECLKIKNNYEEKFDNFKKLEHNLKNKKKNFMLEIDNLKKEKQKFLKDKEEFLKDKEQFFKDKDIYIKGKNNMNLRNIEIVEETELLKQRKIRIKEENVIIDKKLKQLENEKLLEKSNIFNKEKEQELAINKIYKEFDFNFYINNYKDLKNYNKSQAINHYIEIGIKEGRKYNLKQIEEFYTNKIKSINKIPIIKKDEKLFNILIRTCYRPNLFNKCINSILKQNYKNINIVISYDNKKSIDYLKKYNNIDNINYYFIDIKGGEFKYELYQNLLLDKVKDGFVIFLDDDDCFLNDNSLHLINSEIQDANTLILWKYLRSDMEIYPEDISNIYLGSIASCSYCFNIKYLNNCKWIDQHGGDYLFFEQLLFKNNFDRKFIHEILTGISDPGYIVGNGMNEKYDRKISIIMAYYNRKTQIINTLNQFQKLYSDRFYNYEVIIVDDKSDKEHRLEDIIKNYSFNINLIRLNDKNWINPVIPLNIGISNISKDSEIVVLQNPEIFHCGNILDYILKNLGNNYLTFPIFNSPDIIHNNKLYDLSNKKKPNYIKDFIDIIDYNQYRKGNNHLFYEDIVIDKWKGWYNHIKYNNRQLHFLSAINKTDLDKIGFFNEDMKDGLWYDDDEFLIRIKKLCSVKTVESNEYIGIHQYHSGGSNENRKLSNFSELSKKNKLILEESKNNTKIYYDNNYSKDLRQELYTNHLKLENFNKSDNTIIYYSKLNYNLLFQRPQQIMRYLPKNYNKIFISSCEFIKYEKKYNLLIVPYSYREKIIDFFKDTNINIYYTDPRLYDEIIKIKGKKLFDLIDAPIDEFSVWKPNLEKCVKNSDHVIYSHPDLVKFLTKIDDSKQYKYISNACDYEHFSLVKERIGKRPCDFPKIDKPILGYYGAFSEWLDYDIIRKTADEGVYHIIMIGGLEGNARYNMRFEHDNITWLDHKSYDELPYYLSWFDKCFLPFKECELTKYVNPCKLWEYMASGKEIIKHNVNMEVYEIVTYDDICENINNLILKNKSIAIVLDKYLKGGIEKHSNILEKELNADVFVFKQSLKNHQKINDLICSKYDVVLWQNVFNKLPPKTANQKYVYIVHSQCDWWNDKQRMIVKENNNLIDTYIYVSDSVKENFEKNVLKPDNGYVIENQLPEMKNDKQDIPGLFVSSGTFNKMKGHLKLIQEFSKLDNSNTLEIYGDIHNKDYFNMLKKYINDKKLNNIKLFEYTDDYINRLKEAEYFCLFSKSEGCSYSMLEAISLNKKIICSKQCLTDNMLNYPNLCHEFKKYEKQNYKYNSEFIKYYEFINNIDYFVDVKKSLLKNNYSKNDFNYLYYSIFFDNFYKEILNTNKNQMQTRRKTNLQNIQNNDIKLLNKNDKIPKLIFSIWITDTSKLYYPPNDKIIKLKKNIESNPQYTFTLVSNVYLDLDINYNNFKYQKIDLENDYFYGRDILNRYLSENRYTAVSDIIRFNIIYKYGGFYSDLGTKLILPSILNKFDYVIGQEGFCLGTSIFGSKPNSKILYKICSFIDNLNRIPSNIRNISDNILTPPWTSIGILTCLSDIFLDNNELLLPITYNDSIFDVNHMSSWLNKDKNLRFGQPSFHENPIKTTTYFIEDYNYTYKIDTKKDIFSHFNILLFKNENFKLNWEEILKIIKTNRQKITNISKNTYLNSKYILNDTSNVIFHKTWIGNKKIPDKNIYFLKKLDNYLSIFFKNSIIYFWVTDNLVEQQIMDLKLNYIDVKIFDDSKIRGKRIYDIYCSDNRFANANDIARMNILYNYGGIYSDQLVSFEKDLSTIFNSYDYIFYKYEHNGNIDHGIFYTKEVNDRLINVYLDNLDNIESNYGNLKDYFMNSEQELIFSGSHYLQFIIDTQFNDKKIFFLNKPLIQLERGSTWGDITSNIYKSIFQVDDKNKNKIFINYSFKILFDLVPIKILIFEKLSINLIFMANYLLLNYPDCFCYSDKNSKIQIPWKDINKYFNEKVNYDKKKKVLNTINNLKSFDTTYTMKQIYDLYII